MERVPFYLGLGSNLGRREEYLYQALNLLSGMAGIRLLACSPIYETEPVGFVDQPPFLNMAVKGETTLTAWQLLRLTSKVEEMLGRKRAIRWGPRTIDLDILLFGQLRLHTEELKLPHPRLKERAFVLLPLADIAADLVIPGVGQSVRELLEKVSRKGVKPWRTKFILGADGSVHFAS